MSILFTLLGIAISIASAILPSIGIADRYGSAAGWFCGFVLASLFSICFELQKIREILAKDKK